MIVSESVCDVMHQTLRRQLLLEQENLNLGFKRKAWGEQMQDEQVVNDTDDWDWLRHLSIKIVSFFPVLSKFSVSVTTVKTNTTVTDKDGHLTMKCLNNINNYQEFSSMQMTHTSYHWDVFNIAMLYGIKELWAHIACRGGTLSLCPDGNNSFLLLQAAGCRLHALSHHSWFTKQCHIVLFLTHKYQVISRKLGYSAHITDKREPVHVYSRHHWSFLIRCNSCNSLP